VLMPLGISGYGRVKENWFSGRRSY
jgi:hypothetical protein